MKVLWKALLIGVCFVTLAACTAQEERVNKEFILTTVLHKGKPAFLGVGGEINGQINPPSQLAPMIESASS